MVFLVAIVAILLVGWFWWESRHWESTDDAEIDGYIYPISARVSGQVVKVNYDDGQLVHKGDVLVQIDPTDYNVAMERARADYEDSQAQAQAAAFGVPVSSVGSVRRFVRPVPTWLPPWRAWPLPKRRWRLPRPRSRRRRPMPRS